MPGPLSRMRISTSSPWPRVLEPDGGRVALEPHALGGQLAPPFVSGLAGVADDVQEAAPQVLGDGLNLAQVGVQVLLHGQLELRIGGAGAVVGQHGVFHQKRVEFYGLPVLWCLVPSAAYR